MLIMWFFAYKSLPNLLFGVLCLPGDQRHPVCATDNKPSCVLHLLGWFIGSRGFSSLERRPEFWVLQGQVTIVIISYKVDKCLTFHRLMTVQMQGALCILSIQ